MEEVRKHKIESRSFQSRSNHLKYSKPSEFKVSWVKKESNKGKSENCTFGRYTAKNRICLVSRVFEAVCGIGSVQIINVLPYTHYKP